MPPGCGECVWYNQKPPKTRASRVAGRTPRSQVMCAPHTWLRVNLCKSVLFALFKRENGLGGRWFLRASRAALPRTLFRGAQKPPKTARVREKGCEDLAYVRYACTQDPHNLFARCAYVPTSLPRRRARGARADQPPLGLPLDTPSPTSLPSAGHNRLAGRSALLAHVFKRARAGARPAGQKIIKNLFKSF